jgi:DNA-binding response OmpR family regulator
MTKSDPTRLNGLKVLVVEDQPIMAMTLEEMLRAIGCTAVWHASGVTDALAMMRTNRPDCAVVDLYLSGEPAYPIARWLDSERIPYVFLKGYGRRTILGDWASRPAIQKPFSVRALQAKLIAALDQHESP